MNKVCDLTIDEYIGKIERFHGHLAPGLITGGFMVDLAMRERPAGDFFDVVCETATCLPDAVQILTPCTIGNGWLKIVNVGRFALAVFEKYSGEGVRVHLEARALDAYPEFRDWFLKRRPKHEQDRDRLVAEIIEAGNSVLVMSRIQVVNSLIGKQKGGSISLCPGCSEAYPVKDGGRCLACQGSPLYRSPDDHG